ncbi:MAG: hypothetical protein ACI9BO_001021 [Zhongshania sp.]
MAQKIVSKAESRYINLEDIEPDSAAGELAERCDKDPRQMVLELREAKQVLRSCPGVVIVEHKLGLVHANAGRTPRLRNTLYGNAHPSQLLNTPASKYERNKKHLVEFITRV